jgi:hypothetical protein
MCVFEDCVPHLADSTGSQHDQIVALSDFSSADVLVIVNAIHLIIFGAVGMAVEAKIQFIVSGVTFMNNRLGKGTVVLAGLLLASDLCGKNHGLNCKLCLNANV